jgi:diguanylate cyclase (GGDEF)-like protein
MSIIEIDTKVRGVESKMKKALIVIFSVFSLIGFAAIVVFNGYMIYASYEKNLVLREKEFPNLVDRIVSDYIETRSFKSELFDKKIEDVFKDNKQLIVIDIYSKNEGIKYFAQKKPDDISTYFKSNTTNTRNNRVSDWMGKPEYQKLPISSRILTLKLLKLDNNVLFIDGIFQPIDLSEVSQYIKWSFFILFVWLILTFIIRLFVSTKSMREIYEMGLASDESDNKETEKIKDQANNIGSDRSGDTGESGPDHASSDGINPEESIDNYKTESKEDNVHEIKKETSISLFSPNTGLGWQDHLPERLKFEINRTASFNQDMVLAVISIDDFSFLKDSFSIYKSIAKSILNSFPFQDLAFEFEKDGYAVILPDQDINQGIKNLEIFQRKIARTDFGNQQVTLSVGLSARAGRLMSEKTLLQEAGKGLEKAKEEGKNRIIAFKADADKYRKVISESF